jgi:hypothetical protein
MGGVAAGKAPHRRVNRGNSSASFEVVAMVDDASRQGRPEEVDAHRSGGGDDNLDRLSARLGRAEARDQAAESRDRAAAGRDEAATRRPPSIEAETLDRGLAAVDRAWSGIDRDAAAADRLASLETIRELSLGTGPSTALRLEVGAPERRDTRQVIEAHLRHRQAGDLEGDLAENYAENVAVLSWGEGVQHGHDAVRRTAKVLRCYLPEAGYSYDQLLVEGEVAMLQWHADGLEMDIHDGVDSYVVRGGLIVAQTIHYSTEPVGRR